MQQKNLTCIYIHAKFRNSPTTKNCYAYTYTETHTDRKKTHLMNNKQKYLNTITRNLRDNTADFKNWNGLMRLGTMQKIFKF